MRNIVQIDADIVTSDNFLDMPLSAQCLYFHLLINSDESGKVRNIKSLKRCIRASEDDVMKLLDKHFIERYGDVWTIKRNTTGSN